MDRSQTRYLEGQEALWAAVRAGRVTHADVYVGSLMNLLADEQGMLRDFSYADLARCTTHTPATVARHVRALMAAGLVRRLKGGIGLQRSTYVVTPDAEPLP